MCGGARMCVQISTQKHMAILMLEIHYLPQEVSGNGRKVRGGTDRIDEGKLEN